MNPKDTPQVWLLLAITAWLFGSCAGSASATQPREPVEGTPVTTTETEATPSDVEPRSDASPQVSPDTAYPSPDTPVWEQLSWILETLATSGVGLTEEEVLARVTEDFAQAVPPAELIAEIRGQTWFDGPTELVGFDGEMTPYQLTAVLACDDDRYYRLRIRTEEEPEHRLTGLNIRRAIDLEPGTLPVESFTQFDRAIRSEASEVSFLAAELTDEGLTEVFAIDADRPLAIGSAFKLYVLLALAETIRSGRANWDDALAIRDDWLSLPSGRMQNEQAGTPFPLRYYAEQMISISDNTATDHLVHHIGRGAVERAMAVSGHHAPDRNVPFLTTREMFAIKLMLDTPELDRYLSLSPEEKRRYLETEVAQMNVGLALFASAFWTQPYRIDQVEWFASAQDISRVLSAIKESGEAQDGQPILDILSINPGLPLDTEQWTYIGYKGGSEPGVLNLSWLLHRRDDRWFVLTISCNDREHALNEDRIFHYVLEVAKLLSAWGL